MPDTEREKLRALQAINKNLEKITLELRNANKIAIANTAVDRRLAQEYE